jgi:PAS domain S-box-containing protein
MTKIRVLIAENDAHVAAAIADSLATVPDLEVAGTATEAESVIQLASDLRPDVVLMDVRLPGGGARATRDLLAAQPATRVVALSAYDDQSSVLEMLEAGAIAYLVKGGAEVELLEAMRRAARGQLSLPAERGASLVRDLLREAAERRLAEATLRKSEERFHGLLQAAPDAMVITSVGGAIELVNAQFELLFGYTQEELTGQQIEMLLPERLRDIHVKHRDGYMAAPHPRPLGFGLELVGRRRDGTEFPVDISLSPLQTEDGVRSVAAIRDITERRRTEDAMRKSEQRFRDLLESAPDAMVIVDEAGRIQLVNARTEELFGYGRANLLGESVDMLLPDRMRRLHPRHRADYVADPSSRPMGAGLELFGKRRNGTEFPVDISLSPLRTEEGLLVVAAIRDASERKVAERQLAQTVELAERERLFAHVVRVQEEERLRIASDIHDDTVQAMTAASLRLQQLRRHLTVERDLELLTKLEQAVQESIERLRRLMFDLRPPALDRSGLAPALRDLVDRLEEETGLSCSLRNDLLTEPPVNVRISLYRIAQEALTNVRKHAQAKRVEVALSRQEAGSLVKIGDDGIGFVPAEAVEKPGHLGLVSMRERARVAGGWLKLESKPGTGTTVTFWVPDAAGTDPLLSAVRGV